LIAIWKKQLFGITSGILRSQSVLLKGRDWLADRFVAVALIGEDVSAISRRVPEQPLRSKLFFGVVL
jgi:hypothetical protein